MSHYYNHLITCAYLARTQTCTQTNDWETQPELGMERVVTIASMYLHMIDNGSGAPVILLQTT